MRKPGRWVVAAAVGMLLCLVSGCSGSSEQPGSTATASGTDSPTTSASASATASSSTSPQPTAEPSIPPDARPATIDGAQKFAAFWVSQFNLALRTADAGPIAAISGTECAACQGFISEANEFRDRGEHLEGDLWVITNNNIDKFDNVASAVVITSTKQNHVARLDNNGSVVVMYKERTEDLAFTLQHNGQTWVVTNLQVVK
ncbi:MAG: DUF6318 family protein [Dermatophilaceae bacterium]